MIDPFDPRGVSRYDSPQVDQIRSQEQPSPADHHWNVWSVTVVLGLRAPAASICCPSTQASR